MLSFEKYITINEFNIAAFNRLVLIDTVRDLTFKIIKIKTIDILPLKALFISFVGPKTTLVQDSKDRNQ